MSQITTHILDIASGKPAVDVPITLFALHAGQWQQLGTGKTNGDGRISDLCAPDVVLTAGDYRMHFDTASYFDGRGDAVFYPWADVVFRIDGDGQHYHIPLLLAPHGYSTYRGS